jgi:hydroxymethylglutaryl-CoA reductase
MSESIEKLEELIDDDKMSSFLKILKVESFVVGSNLISKLHFNYLAL